MIAASEIKQLIEKGLPDATVQVYGDDGQHFEAIVESPSFIGIGLVAQHKMVYAALGNSFDDALHALALKTAAPINEQN